LLLDLHPAIPPEVIEVVRLNQFKPCLEIHNHTSYPE
jgi:hypothetical protein